MDFRRWFYVAPLRLRAVLRRPMLERQLDDEIRYHIEQETAFRMRRGESQEVARSGSIRDFGGIERYKDEARDARGISRFEDFVRDLRFAIRSLSRAKAFTLVAVVTLALGIGANSAVFTLIDAILLHPINVGASERLVSISQAITDKAPHERFSFPTYRAMVERAQSFAGIAVFATQDAVVATAGEPQQVATSAVSGNYFSVLGVGPQIGRMLTAEDDGTPGAHPVTVLSDALWERAYRRSPQVIGSTLKIGMNAFTIVGVAPRGFRGTVLSEAPQLWVPATMLTDLGLTGFFSSQNRSRLFGLPHFYYWNVVGRLHDGVERAHATAELNVIVNQERANDPRHVASAMGFAGREVQNPVTLTGLNEAAAWSDRDDLVRFVWILSTVVVLTLLIACFNVGNLIFVRNGHRALELSVRASLGASRGRLAQQLMLESLLIGVSGAVAGVLLGRAGLRLIGSFTLPGDIRLRDISFTLNHRVLGVTIALGVLTALIFGLAPIGQASRADLNARLRGARATMSTRARRWFLGAEIALSIILLVGAGLFVRSLQKGLHSDLGFNPSPLAAIRINPALSGYRGAQLSGFYQLATERASQIPGVTGVALSSHVPLSSISPLPFVASEKLGASSIDDQVSAGWVYVSAGFFDVLGVPIIDGRGFMPNDSASSSVAIINQTAAETLFPDGHPVGKEIVHAGSMHFTVIGVVRDTKYQSVADRRVPMVFTPMESDYGDDVHLVVRSNRPVAALEDLRRVVRSIPPYTPIQDARLVQRQIDRVLEPQRFGSTLLGSYSIIALVIASVGVYGLFAYAVSTQRREIGIRIALGAQAPEIVRLLAARTVVAVLGGVIVGLLGGVAASRAMTRFLYGVAPTDPPTYAAAASVMLAASIIACVPSVRRALRIDPVTSMRIE